MTVEKWHPLQPYIEQVKKRAEEITDIEGTRMKIGKPDLNICNNFDIWMDLIISEGRPEDEELIKVFEPLKVTNYKGYALFKYRSYIELNDMGYGGDFFELYNGLYRECRSVVFDLRDCTVALAAMNKFKNYGEEQGGEWSEKSIQDKYNNAYRFNITEKMDGSYQQYRWLEDEERVIGSGSSALDVEESWRLQKGFELLDSNYKAMLSHFPWLTFCFEYISPDNPVVVKYTKEQEGLYLFTARSVLNGVEMTYDWLKRIAEFYNVKIVKSYDNESLSSLMNQLDKYTSDEKEGWVISLWESETSDIPFRFKMKVDDYVLMHKALSKNISPNAIIRAIRDDKFDDFLSKVPEAYKEMVNSIANEVFMYTRTVDFYVKLIYKRMELSYIPTHTVKDFMIWTEKNLPKVIRSYVRNLYLGRENYYLNQSNMSNFGCYHLKEIQDRTNEIERHKKEIFELAGKIKREGKSG